MYENIFENSKHKIRKECKNIIREARSCYQMEMLTYIVITNIKIIIKGIKLVQEN